MNTGYQRSSSTSKGSWTSTTPVSKEGKGGKPQHRKDFPLIMALHDLPYVATASPAYIPDLVRKVENAMAVKEGLAYIHIYNPCLTGWGIKSDDSIAVSRLSVKSHFFPLWEAHGRHISITVRVPDPVPVADYIKRIGKFRHLDAARIAELQAITDERYQYIEAIEKLGEK
jgi:pyruvate ferredoxin oxidoreductase beta subunit/phenylglyoxylate dehydrogenase beta subunit